ncbi:hypothetical protein [Mycobacteroides abscessus]|uniref:hypothetical protein n=1 Tax=Mycobacteroides abscessus TaxID=36809 RepID=UPI0009280874|nr:hypothetical protein [Mycobacteroides abscessus]SIF34978.1 Uncharacterised protein [Mycobacteroides abscessus subsp. abscessus]
MTTSTPTKDSFAFYAEPSQLTPASDLYTGWGQRDGGAPMFSVVGTKGDIELSVAEAHALIGELGQFVVENSGAEGAASA